MSPVKRFLLILALTAMWSPSFLFIKLAIHEIPPLTIVAARVTLAALILLAILRFKKFGLPTDKKFWFHSGVMAFVSSVLPFYLFCYAEQSIESALAAILNGASPMFTAFLAQLFIPSDRLTPQKTFGIGLSACGLVLLFLPNLIDHFTHSGMDHSLAMGAALGAAFCYATGHVYAKKFLIKQRPFVAPATQLILSSLMLLPLAFWFDSPLSLPIPSLQAVGGVLGLALFGTVCAFIIYYALLEHCGPTAISMVACFFPAGGMLLGYLFLGETLDLRSLLAAALILSGVVVVNELVRFRRPLEEEASLKKAL